MFGVSKINHITIETLKGIFLPHPHSTPSHHPNSFKLKRSKS